MHGAVLSGSQNEPNKRKDKKEKKQKGTVSPKKPEFGTKEDKLIRNQHGHVFQRSLHTRQKKRKKKKKERKEKEKKPVIGLNLRILTVLF
jgi:hypothetical protein